MSSQRPDVASHLEVLSRSHVRQPNQKVVNEANDFVLVVVGRARLQRRRHCEGETRAPVAHRRTPPAEPSSQATSQPHSHVISALNKLEMPSMPGPCSTEYSDSARSTGRHATRSAFFPAFCECSTSSCTSASADFAGPPSVAFDSCTRQRRQQSWRGNDECTQAAVPCQDSSARAHPAAHHRQLSAGWSPCCEAQTTLSCSLLSSTLSSGATERDWSRPRPLQ